MTQSNVVHLDPFQKYKLDRDDLIARYNRDYTHMVIGGKNYVVRLARRMVRSGGTKFEFMPVHEFKMMKISDDRINVPVQQADGSIKFKAKASADIWIESKEKNTAINGLRFDPSLPPMEMRDGCLNAWQGFGVVPKGHSGEAFRVWCDHVLNVICNGDVNVANYVIRWFAHAVQKPGEKPETAIILKADQGSGKGSLMKPFQRIFSGHYYQSQNSSDFTGRFNSALENRVMTFFDEAFAGSKEAADTLKGLISEPTQRIERKGVDPVEVDSFIRVVMASNHDNIVRIERSDRRYLMLETSNDWIGNEEYFSNLYSKIDSQEGAEDILAGLMSIDLSEFEPRRVPKTKALDEQKIDYLEPIEMFIYSKLKDEQIPARQPITELQAELSDFLQINRLHVHGSNGIRLGKLLKKLDVAKRTRSSDQSQGRPWLYEFETLSNCRKAFEKYLSVESIEW